MKENEKGSQSALISNLLKKQNETQRKQMGQMKPKPGTRPGSPSKK